MQSIGIVVILIQSDINWLLYLLLSGRSENGLPHARLQEGWVDTFDCFHPSESSLPLQEAEVEAFHLIGKVAQGWIIWPFSLVSFP